METRSRLGLRVARAVAFACEQFAQDAREKALNLFRQHAEGRSPRCRDRSKCPAGLAETSDARDTAAVLVATDVAARGLDIPDITCVVHYDLPRRWGCTSVEDGRLGCSLCSNQD